MPHPTRSAILFVGNSFHDPRRDLHLGKKLHDELRVPKEMLTSHAGHCEIPLFEAPRYYEAVSRFVRSATE